MSTIHWSPPGQSGARRCVLAGLLAFLSAAGCVGPRHAVITHTAACGQRGVVCVVDGAGGFEASTKAVSDAVAAEGLPLRVESFDWTHGYGRAIADQLDYEHAISQGKFLAGHLVTLRRREPAQEIYVIAHSAGSAVALVALGYLPRDSVDRVILLAPAVSADYDIRPALRASREGVDVFYSERDRFFLGFGTGVLGTTDRRWDSPAAGRVGFCPPGVDPEDPLLLSRLRQHPWDPSQACAGNFGGHYGSYEPPFLHAYVLPLLQARGVDIPVCLRASRQQCLPHASESPGTRMVSAPAKISWTPATAR